MRFQRILLCSGVLLAGACAPAVAQVSERPGEVQKRNNCRLAAQVLNTGEPHTREAWARATIINCEDEGPAYFSTRWQSAAADTMVLRELIAGSTRIRDARVYACLREAVADRSRPDAVRVAAMIALARYVDAGIAIDLSELRVPDGPVDRIRFSGGSAIDVVQVPGARPLGPVGAEVHALLSGIAADREGEPREVWYAAAVLARRVERQIATR